MTRVYVMYANAKMLVYSSAVEHTNAYATCCLLLFVSFINLDRKISEHIIYIHITMYERIRELNEKSNNNKRENTVNEMEKWNMSN